MTGQRGHGNMARKVVSRKYGLSSFGCVNIRKTKAFLIHFCEHGNGEFVSRNDLTMQQINEIFAGKRVHHHG